MKYSDDSWNINVYKATTMTEIINLGLNSITSTSARNSKYILVIANKVE